MTYDANERLARMRGDAESDWPIRLLANIAKAPLIPESELSWTRDVGLVSPAVARVLQAASFGLTNEMIADAFGVSAETVKSQMRQGLLVLGAKNRTQACCVALREGIIR